MSRNFEKPLRSRKTVRGHTTVDAARIEGGAIPKSAFRCLWLILALLIPATFAHGAVITIRTGQLGPPSNPSPGACPALDYNFSFYAQYTPCGQPISGGQPFGENVGEFWHAWAGPQAKVISNYSSWPQFLPADLDARWINFQVDGNCLGTPAISTLYCAEFDIPCECVVADSIKICWMVDDALGDPPGQGENTGGVYINEASLGPDFTGIGAGVQHCGVARNVPIHPGLNRLHVYQRDLSCVASGLILSCSVYYQCSVPVEEKSWGAIKAMYR
jgi:hypothetical protein